MPPWMAQAAGSLKRLSQGQAWQLQKWWSQRLAVDWFDELSPSTPARDMRGHPSATGFQAGCNWIRNSVGRILPLQLWLVFGQWWGPNIHWVMIIGHKFGPPHVWTNRSGDDSTFLFKLDQILVVLRSPRGTVVSTCVTYVWFPTLAMISVFCSCFLPNMFSNCFPYVFHIVQYVVHLFPVDWNHQLPQTGCTSGSPTERPPWVPAPARASKIPSSSS